MDNKLYDILGGNTDNCIFPFFWQQGNHADTMAQQLQTLYDCGVRSVCVESRPHPDFCGKLWWDDMTVLLKSARELGMTVWVLDDDHFPTGHANGEIAKYHPELRGYTLIEQHVDMIGPMKDATAVLNPLDSEDLLLGAYAYRRDEVGALCGNPLDVTDRVCNRRLCFDLPDGYWRVFFIYRSRFVTDDYIDYMRAESVRVLIDAVYERHYKHFAEYFGNTLAGFFSDEPRFGNRFFRGHVGWCSFYHSAIGTPGLALPYNEQSCCPLSETPLLWYDGEGADNARYKYMNAITDAYSRCFTQQLGDWCAQHKVEYIGHIVEDMNSSGKLGGSAGHFFRALHGQHMSGCDIVLHQVMPGYAKIPNVCRCEDEQTDPEFYHYVLAQLCASDAATDPVKQGRAMCEVFGAYGWAEGAPMQKWLVDFLLVRGVNRLVPHAISPSFPNPDCPPHFGCCGHDPQLEGFSALMHYAQNMCSLFTGGQRVTTAAIIYDAELEWCNAPNEFMRSQKPATLLLDNHIGYDILPFDRLEQATRYDCVIVPEASYIPEQLLNRLRNCGVRVIFVNTPHGDFGECVALGELADYLRQKGAFDITLCGCPLLRHIHIKRASADYYMFCNESVTETQNADISLKNSGEYRILDLLGGTVKNGFTDDGSIHLSLPPYNSCVVYFDNEYHDIPLKAAESEQYSYSPLPLEYAVSIASYTDLDSFSPYCGTTELFNINAADRLPEFSGKIRYTADFQCDTPPKSIDLGRVGQTAQLLLNGVDCGISIVPPYRFYVSGAAKTGLNHIEITVANTLANAVGDKYSAYVQLPPSGLLGPVQAAW